MADEQPAVIHGGGVRFRAEDCDRRTALLHAAEKPASGQEALVAKTKHRTKTAFLLPGRATLGRSTSRLHPSNAPKFLRPFLQLRPETRLGRAEDNAPLLAIVRLNAGLRILSVVAMGCVHVSGTIWGLGGNLVKVANTTPA